MSTGQVCPYCRFTLKPGAAMVSCPACSAVHHQECWKDNGGCAILGCAAAPASPTQTAPVAPPAPVPAAPAPAPTGAAPDPPPPSPRRVSGLVIAAVLAVLAASAAAVVAVVASGKDQAPARTRTVVVTATPAETEVPTVAPDTSTPEPTPTSRPARRTVTFQTGTDPGESAPATFCRIKPSGLYCWTPNDGFTLFLDGSGARRLRGDEPTNKDHVPNYSELSIGSTRRAYGYTCVSATDGLTCQSRAGHGWDLPRYKGLPTIY